MKKVVILLLFLNFVNALNLKGIIDFIDSKNGYIKAKEFELLSKNSDILAIKSSYMPTVDIFASYNKNSPKNITTPGVIKSYGVAINAKIYDGGKRANDIKAKYALKGATAYELKALKRSLKIKAINLYYSYFKALANKKALLDEKKVIKAQIDRIEKFINSGMATGVNLDRLRAFLAQNEYALSEVELNIKSIIESLNILTHKKFNSLSYSHFLTPKRVVFSKNEDVLKLISMAKALKYNENSAKSAKRLQVNLSYRYKKNSYEMVESSPFGGLPNHNMNLNLNANLRVFDGGVTARRVESIKYQKLALISRAKELEREQKRDFKLAKLKLNTIKSNIKSAKMALNASNSNFLSVKKQYEAGLVDYVTFLDALTQKSLSYSRYKSAIYDYEIAKAYVYYYGGKNLKGYIK